MDWFRMYSEFASDPKVQSMSEPMQRRLMMLLCLRCSNALVTLQDDEIAFALRISEEELAETKVLFLRKSFIDDAWEISNWDKRQFISDSSAARVARHRSKQKEDKKVDMKRNCNVTVTPQNRTEQNRTEELPHTPQAGRKTDSAIGLPAYIDKCRADGKKPIDENHAVFSYASKINLSHEFLRLHWCEFKYRYSLPNAKRYKAWQTVFDKSVRGNWFKLWFEAENGYALTTVGKQAKMANREAA